MKDLALVVGDIPKIAYQIKEDDVVVDISGYAFTFGAKIKASDTAYQINPIDGDIDDATAGKFSFTLEDSSNDSVLTSTFSGLFEVGMTNSSSERTTITPAGGVLITVRAQISS